MLSRTEQSRVRGLTLDHAGEPKALNDPIGSVTDAGRMIVAVCCGGAGPVGGREPGAPRPIGQPADLGTFATLAKGRATPLREGVHASTLT